jgi:hypothetical protein
MNFVQYANHDARLLVKIGYLIFDFLAMVVKCFVLGSHHGCLYATYLSKFDILLQQFIEIINVVCIHQ